MSDILTVLASTLLTDQPGGEFVNSNENTAAKNTRQPALRSTQWHSVLEGLSGIDTQLREIQQNFQEFIGNLQDPLLGESGIGSAEGFFETGEKENVISALVENTERAIEGINQEISDLLLENSKAGVLRIRWGGGRRMGRSQMKSRSHWA